MAVKPLPFLFQIKSIESQHGKDYANILEYDDKSVLVEIKHLQLANKYLIKILINSFGYPEVYMMENKRQKKELSKEIPHIYTKSSRLCLYYPGEWKRNMLFSSTILPWTIEWLLAYEHWLENKEWIGKEIKHNSNK